MQSGKGYILLIDDEPDVVSIHSRTLTQEGYVVKTATDGAIALSMIQSENFDLVISDINMPNQDGIALLKSVRASKPQLKVILMTGFTAEHAPQEAIDLGCHGFLAKPVSKAELLDITRDSLSNAPDDKISSKNYARIPLTSFFSGRKVEFSLYVRLTESRFLKIAHSGNDIDLPRIHALHDRGVTELWIEQTDLEKYSRMSKDLAKVVSTKASMAGNTGSKVLLNACEIAAEDLRLNGLSEKSVEAAVASLQMAIEFLATRSTNGDVLAVFLNASPTSYSKAATSACLCGLIARVMGWTSYRTVVSLTLAGFLKDVGLYSLPHELQNKPVTSMSAEEYKEYKKHPLISVDCIKKNILNPPPETLTAIAEHHELATPESFPKCLSRSAIFPMAKIVSLVDLYVEALVLLPAQTRSDPAKLVRVIEGLRPKPLDEIAAEVLALLIKTGDVAAATERFKRLGQSRPTLA